MIDNELAISINKTLNKQRDFFMTHKTKDIKYRIDALKKLKQSILLYEKEINDALYNDLKKSEFESYVTEIGLVLEEITHNIKKIKKWTKSKKIKTPITNFKAKSYIHHEPYGIVLIISPWNYPFQLIMSPLIGAISAGNCAILKPAELSTNTSNVIKKIIENTFPSEYISVFNGGKDVNLALLQEKFDYIFFTGSPTLGKIVMEAATKHLTPITLELGGKSPCIVDSDANIEIAAKRIVWGKFLNSGQTCVAPDYLLVHETIKNRFIEELKKQIKSFFGDNPQDSPDYPRIISDLHFSRLINLLDDGEICFGGKHDAKDRYIEPTLILVSNYDSNIMKDEIFGPILPIIEFENIESVENFISNKAKPLALYYFGDNPQKQNSILTNISFGGGCINDTMVHLANLNLPFGGVGYSGMGIYHGYESFRTFSHIKSILKKSTFFDLKFRYPPYKDKLKMIKKLLK